MEITGKIQKACTKLCFCYITCDKIEFELEKISITTMKIFKLELS